MPSARFADAGAGGASAERKDNFSIKRFFYKTGSGMRSVFGKPREMEFPLVCR